MVLSITDIKKPQTQLFQDIRMGLDYNPLYGNVIDQPFYPSVIDQSNKGNLTQNQLDLDHYPFPIASHVPAEAMVNNHGIRTSPKAWLKQLLNQQFFDNWNNNIQPQPTTVPVMGTNPQLGLLQENKYPQFVGSANGGESQLFNAPSASTSNIANTIAQNFIQTRNNPLVQANYPKEMKK